MTQRAEQTNSVDRGAVLGRFVYSALRVPMNQEKRHSFLILTMLPTRTVKHWLSFQPTYNSNDALFLTKLREL